MVFWHGAGPGRPGAERENIGLSLFEYYQTYHSAPLHRHPITRSILQRGEEGEFALAGVFEKRAVQSYPRKTVRLFLDEFSRHVDITLRFLKPAGHPNVLYWVEALERTLGKHQLTLAQQFSVLKAAVPPGLHKRFEHSASVAEALAAIAAHAIKHISLATTDLEFIRVFQRQFVFIEEYRKKAEYAARLLEHLVPEFAEKRGLLYRMVFQLGLGPETANYLADKNLLFFPDEAVREIGAEEQKICASLKQWPLQ